MQEVRFTLGSRVNYDPLSYSGTYTASTDYMDLFGTSSSSTFAAIRDTTGQLRLSYVDSWGGAYAAHAAGGVVASTNSLARDSMEVALETLPNQKVRDVKIDTAMTKSGDANNGGIDNVIQRRYLITFKAQVAHSANVGLQNPLLCPSAYTCTEPGCQPMVTMPFLYRYAGTKQDTPLATTIAGADIGAGSTATYAIDFFTGDANTNAGATARNFVRLHPDSQPQMPLGTDVDIGVSASSLKRYDMRILVAVIDPVGGGDSDVDLLYTRVIYGHDSIMSNKERVGSTTAGPWATGASFTTTLDGFTLVGPVPLNAAGSGVSTKVPVPGAPGTFLQFDTSAGRNYVRTDGYGRWYEIMVKLPACSVTPVTAANQVKNFGLSTYVTPVDLNVENIECSGRGKCNRKSGACQCHTGFAGIACQSQSVLV